MEVQRKGVHSQLELGEQDRVCVWVCGCGGSTHSWGRKCGVQRGVQLADQEGVEPVLPDGGAPAESFVAAPEQRDHCCTTATGAGATELDALEPH